MARFSNNAVDRIRTSVKWTEGQRGSLQGPTSDPIRRRKGVAVAYGKVVTTSLNGIGVTPCDAQGTVTDPAPADITIYVAQFDPGDSTISAADLWLNLSPGEVVAYIPITPMTPLGPEGIALPMHQLPTGEGQYKVLQLGADGRSAWDFVRAH